MEIKYIETIVLIKFKVNVNGFFVIKLNTYNLSYRSLTLKSIRRKCPKNFQDFLYNFNTPCNKNDYGLK